MISDVIISVAAILKFFFYHFFCNITKYDPRPYRVNTQTQIALKRITLLCRDKPAEMKYNFKFKQW